MTVTQVNNQWYWLYAVVDSATNRLLQACLFSTLISWLISLKVGYNAEVYRKRVKLAKLIYVVNQRIVVVSENNAKYRCFLFEYMGEELISISADKGNSYGGWYCNQQYLFTILLWHF